ncbi:MAG: MBL fold metallo-hydrolase [Bdellovibrionales bacterium]|nr:MBL fold metallo-hydrolase [Bdellovibrionales bacterium]
MNTIVKDVRELIQDETSVSGSWRAKVVVNDDNMTYVVWNEASRECIVVDPVKEDLETLLSICKNELQGYRFLGVIDTHTHADHLSCAGELAQKLGVPLIQHQLSPSKKVHLRVNLDTSLITAAGPLKLLTTPGHTADCITPIWGPFIFGGDMLLFGDTGRDDLPGGDAEAHWESLQKIKDHAQPGMLLLPGHDGKGGRVSSWKNQLELNVALTQDKKTFVQDGGAWTGPAPKLLKESLYENFK